MRPLRFLLSLAILAAPVVALGDASQGVAPDQLPGLKAAATITRDGHGIAHIRAGNEHDLFFLQGYVHAEDRLFQMDSNRRLASGTLAELLGPGALESDVQLRTIGIRRAAERSWSVISPRTKAALEAYAKGVNAWVRTHPLPKEYEALGLTTFVPWAAIDSVTVAKSIAFSLSFGLEDIEGTVALLTYQAVLGTAKGYALFNDDLFRAQPFTDASTVPDATAATPPGGWHPRPRPRRGWDGPPWAAANEASGRLAHRYLDKVRRIPFLRDRLDQANRPGSNQWAVAGFNTTTGRPLVANDPHLSLGTPSTFYPIHLAAGAYDVMGSGFAGVPFVIVGQNRRIAWGATVNPIDVTDVYQETIQACGTPFGLCTTYKGSLEPIVPIPEKWYVNVGGTVVEAPAAYGLPAATLVVPRRNNGPIVDLDLAAGTAISVQFTGFSPTREVDTFLIWNTARGLNDFLEGLQYFDVGGQNFAYADVAGNIAYLTSSEIPIREDLQAMTVTTPPWFIRDGTGGHEWLPVVNKQPGQAIPYEILPFAEMPHLINPPGGWFVNANNDPAGTNLDNDPLNQLRPGGGIYYLNRIYDAGFRGGRITELVRGKLAAGQKLSFEDMQAIQADVVLLDARFFVPYIRGAFAKLGAAPPFGADARLGEAVRRLAAWDFSSPTGVREGYDAADVNGERPDPTDAEIAASIATTIYSVWRGQFVKNTIDATLGGYSALAGVELPRPPGQLPMTALKTLFGRPVPGVGLSGVDFFNAPGATGEDRRDLVILKSLADALDLLAGDAFDAAFGKSADQDDYRWGRLHRIVMRHPLGQAFNLPGLTFPPSFFDLPGLATDGGFGAVDASNHDVRAASANAFMFGSGPVNRFVAEGDPWGVRAESVWPGGTSGVPGSPYYSNLLPLWLTNDTIPLLYRLRDLWGNVSSVQKFVPAKDKK
jgi:penicillin amidase